jgi:hypothetical protein
MLGIKSNGPNGAGLSLTSAKLLQNIPNPFNQTTLIGYYLPQNYGQAFLKITSISGQTIKSIVLTGNGNGQLNVQTSQLAAGTYTYTLIVDGNVVDTKEMVLIR